MRVSIVVAVMAVALVAHGDNAKMRPEAQDHFERGSHAYELQKYDDAIAEFQAGYLVEPRAEFLYAIGQAYRMKGDCEHAVRSYEAVVRAPDGKQLAEAARQNIERCPRNTAPPVAPEGLASPPPAPTRPSLLAPPPTPRPRPSASADVPWYRDAIGDALVLGGLAIASGGAVVWKLGHDEAERTRTAASYDQWMSSYANADNAELLQHAGVGGIAVGASLAIAGVVRYVWPRSHAEPAPPSGAAAGLSIAF